jgi:hypothetical protein
VVLSALVGLVGGAVAWVLTKVVYGAEDTFRGFLFIGDGARRSEVAWSASAASSNLGLGRG